MKIHFLEDHNRGFVSQAIGAVFLTVRWIMLTMVVACTQEYLECDADIEVSPIDAAAYARFDTDITETTTYSWCKNSGAQFDNRFAPYTGGDKQANLVVEHFSALNCTHCANFAAYVADMQARRPVIKAYTRFYFHHYTFSNYANHHLATFAASQQSMQKFWQFHDILYAGIGASYSYQELRDIAMYDLQLDMTAYDAWTSSNHPEGLRAMEFLQFEKNTAKANCIFGTPTVYLCGERIYDWRNLEEEILKYLQAAN